MQDGDFEIVRKTALFSGLDEASLRFLLSSAMVRRHRRGETLFQQGEDASAFFVVIEGWVKLYRLTRGGDEAVVGVFTRGQCFAEAAAFLAGRYPVTAESVSDSRLLHVPSQGLITRVRQVPDIGLAMLASTSGHLHQLVRHIEQLKVLSGTQRVAEFLVSLCTKQEGTCVVELPYDKALIAGRLGMKPESLSRALSRLRSLGVQTSHNVVSIADVDALRGFIDSDPHPVFTCSPK